MKKVLFIFLLIFNLFPLSMKAQELEWMKSYAAAAPLREKKMAIDTNGNIITLGRKNNGFVLLKYSPTGNLIWDSVSSSITYPNCLALDKNNNIFVVGHYGTYSYMVVVKYNSDHILQWQKNINGSDIFDICVDSLGYSYITGESFDGSYNLFIYKLTPLGDTCWSSWTFDHTSGRKIIVDNQRNVIVTGGIQTNNGDIITIKCDSNGVQKWIKIFDGKYHHSDGPYDLKIDNYGFIYITGATQDSSGNNKYLTIKYKSNGDTSWVREYAPGLDQNPHSIQIDNDRNVIVAGKIYYANNERKLNVLKYDSTGNVLWSRFIDCPISDSYSINSSCLDSSNYIYLTGAYPAGNFNQYSKILSAKYSPEGELKWIDKEPNYDIINKFYTGTNIFINNNSIYVCGNVIDSIFLLKYSNAFK